MLRTPGGCPFHPTLSAGRGEPDEQGPQLGLLVGAEAGEGPVERVARPPLAAGEHTPPRGGDRDSVGAPVVGVGSPLGEALGLEVVDHEHHRGAVDAEPPREVALALRPSGSEHAQHPVLLEPDPEGRERRVHEPCHRDRGPGEQPVERLDARPVPTIVSILIVFHADTLGARQYRDPAQEASPVTSPSASLPPSAGVLGSGEVGKTLAAGLAAKGIAATLGTGRADDPDLVAWAQGAGVRVASFADAARAGDVVFLAVRGASDALRGVLDAAEPGAFDGKVVVDVTNPLVFGDTMPPGLEVGHTDSAGEHLQRRLPNAKVVKAFNTVGNTLMVDPDLPGGPPDMLIAGNDEEAKAAVAAILDAFGWPAIDVGGIERSRELEALSILWVAIGLRRGSWDHAFKLLTR